MRKEFHFLVLLTIAAGSAQASVLDQTQELVDVWGTICSEWHFAQTFTPSMSGQLAQVDVYLENLTASPNPPAYPSTISIVTLVDSEPSGSVLGLVYVEQFVHGFNTIDFLSQSVFFTAGTSYAVVISNDDPDPFDSSSVCWGVAETDVYPGGSLWNWLSGVGWNQDSLMPDFDFSKMDAAFRTYMVPEPLSLTILGLGILPLRKRRR